MGEFNDGPSEGEYQEAIGLIEEMMDPRIREDREVWVRRVQNVIHNRMLKTPIAVARSQRIPKDDEWMAADGTITQIVKMSDGHLFNAIQYFRRTFRGRCLMLAVQAGHYAQTAPDGAADAANMASTEFMDMAFANFEHKDADIAALFPRFGLMIREHRKRMKQRRQLLKELGL